MSDGFCFYLIRREDTGEYFRQAKGPSWARQKAWVKEPTKAKAYGNIAAARGALRMVQGKIPVWGTPDGALAVMTEMELVAMRVVEEGVVE